MDASQFRQALEALVASSQAIALRQADTSEHVVLANGRASRSPRPGAQ